MNHLMIDSNSFFEVKNKRTILIFVVGFAHLFAFYFQRTFGITWTVRTFEIFKLNMEFHGKCNSAVSVCHLNKILSIWVCRISCFIAWRSVFTSDTNFQISFQIHLHLMYMIKSYYTCHRLKKDEMMQSNAILLVLVVTNK